MKELMLNNGDLTFETSDTIEGFENKLLNALQIYGVETFYDINNGLNFDIISSNQTNYKVQHIKSKLTEWFKDELKTLQILEVKVVGKVAKVKIFYEHVTLGKMEKEVAI